MLPLLLLACGRIGFDAKGDGAAPEIDAVPIPGNALYISPQGDDDNNGSHESPFLTFSFALSQLSAGNTLVALPGTYGISTGTGNMDVDCRPGSFACSGNPCKSGEAGSPIVIRAFEERTAHFVAEIGMEEHSISLRECHYIDVEGFTVQNVDDPSGPWANIDVHGSSNIALRRNLLSRSNRMVNGHMLEINRSSRILVEENEFYDFHRDALIVWKSADVTARRNYANARNYADLPDGYTSTDPASGDVAFACHHSARCRFENNISEGRTMDGISIIAGELLPNGIVGAGDDVSVVGNIVVRPNRFAMYARSDCDDAIDCPDEVTLSNLLIRSNLFLLSPDHNLYVRGAQSVIIDHNSSLRNSIRVDLHADNANLDASVAITNTLATDADGVGITVLQQLAWSIDYTNSFGASPEFQTGGETSGLGDNNSMIDPELAGCFHRIPQSSPMSGAGSDGSDIGANIIYRYQDGQLTNTLLWDADTGAFPCGATIPGVNGEGDVCSSVHQRLGIGDACAMQ